MSGQINLMGAVFSPNTAKGVAFPVELQWQAAVPLNENYHVFIHLLDNNGQVVTQADGQPAQWSRPTSTWIVGETVIDRHGLWIPPDITPGEYELSIGLYLPVDGRRLDLARGEESVKFIVTVY
ncbi:MAG: hypothetical protein GY796_06535 [Chloroflexi bacterium]|nr:hypothetical protein [Chloroflexota bacterium]